ncbi:glycoside hydrolase family 25 protein [Novosphingobium panipatense]
MPRRAACSRLSASCTSAADEPMARKGKAASGGGRMMWRVLGAALLLAIVAGAWGWWHLRHWTPERAIYPLQGVEIGAVDGDVSWPALKAIGADFAYIDASASAFARDPGFVRNFEAAKAAGMQVGALHRYDPCQPAGTQAANFVTTVPRDARLLPRRRTGHAGGCLPGKSVGSAGRERVDDFPQPGRDAYRQARHPQGDAGVSIALFHRSQARSQSVAGSGPSRTRLRRAAMDDVDGQPRARQRGCARGCAG